MMHWPCIYGLAASDGVWLRAAEMKITATLWLGKTVLYLFTYMLNVYVFVGLGLG